MLADEPIDTTVLDQLGSLRSSDPDFVTKIVSLYLDTTSSMLKELEAAAMAEDMDWLRLANHSLNSASAAVGAVRVAARCNELDRMLRAGPVINPPDWAKIIAQEYKRAETALRSWIASRAPAEQTANKPRSATTGRRVSGSMSRRRTNPPNRRQQP